MTGAIVLGAVAVFQALLAAGLPLGRAAWGGQYDVLPVELRWASVAAIFVLAVAAWMILARAGLAPPGPRQPGVRIATWVFAGYFALNTAGNIISSSDVERAVMTPVAILLVACFVIVSRSRPGS